jgi:zinc protease
MGVALEVLGQVAFGDNSPLYRRLVLLERRVQALNQSFDLARDPSLVSIQTTVSRPDDVKAVEDAILAEIRAYQDAPIDAARLAATKQNLKYSFLMQLETAQSVAFAVVQPLVDTGRLDAIEDYFRTLDAVTPDDIREAARRFLVESGRTTVTMVQEG